MIINVVQIQVHSTGVGFNCIIQSCTFILFLWSAECFLLQRSNEQGKPIHIVVVSPYTAQVELIKDELAHDRYDVHNQFIVKVQTMDAWQGGKVDMVIFSTVGTYGSSNLVEKWTWSEL